MAALPIGHVSTSGRAGPAHLRLLPQPGAGSQAEAEAEAPPRPARTAVAPSTARPGVARRLVPGLLTLGVLAAAWFGAGALTAARGAGAGGATLVAGAHYVVRPGDTLWTIAVRLDPGGDPRPLVDEMSAQLGGSTIEPGETLVLP